MDIVSPDFILSLAFLLFVCVLAMKDARMTEDRRDRREREYHERKRSDRREFGYQTVEDADNRRSFRRYIRE